MVGVIPSFDGKEVFGFWRDQVLRQSLRFAGATSFQGFSPDRKMMISGFNGSLLIWNTSSGGVIHRLMPSDVEPGTWSVLSVNVSPDSRRAVTVDRARGNTQKTP